MYTTSTYFSFVRATAISFVALAGIIGSAQGAVNLVKNGGFENTSVSGSYSINPGGSTLNNWSSSNVCGGCYNFVYFPNEVTLSDPQGAKGSADGSNPQVWLWAPGNGPTFPLSPSGGNFVALDADPTYRGALTQTITGLTPGGQYLLNFDWGAGQYTTRTGNNKAGLFATLGNSPAQFTGYANNASQSFSGWRHGAMSFTATSSTEVLSFLADGTPYNGPPVAVLDGVSLTQTPEPGYQVLMLAGVGILLGFARFRRKSLTRAV